MTKKYFILVWGCQMNSADAEKVEAILSQLGYRKTAEEKSADLIVAVACSIRQSAINRLYGQACNWQKRRKQGRLLTILTGCVLPKDKNTPIILYCKTGRMSAEALQTMRKLGYTNVRHLAGGMDAWQTVGGKLLDLSTIEASVLPKEGIELPVSWGTLGKQLVDAGVINLPEFEKVVKMTPEQKAVLSVGSDEKIRIDTTNSQFIVDVLWALGLAQKSIVYEEGPMGKEEKANAGNFASTGGWTLARGDAMQYFNRFDFIPLTPDQQKQVGEIAKNVYRPCCGNSTWFPDCNHGMAALAAIELMVSAGVPEKDIYNAVLALNSFWFSETYLTTATYFARQGIAWNDVDAKTVLGREYSSGQGAGMIAKKVGPLPWRPAPSGGGCGA